MSGRSKKSKAKNSKASSKSTCSPALADGSKPCGSPVGSQVDLFGQPVARARLSPQQEKQRRARLVKATLSRALDELASSFASSADTPPCSTRGTFGRKYGGSPESAALTSSLENRCRAAMDLSGSPEYKLRWKYSDMPLGRSICRLRASARRTSDSGCTGWQTPQAHDAHKRGTGNRTNGKGGGGCLAWDAELAGWPTAAARDWREGRSNQHGKNARPLNEVAQLVGWNTPRATDGENGGPHQTGGSLPADAALAGWPTPMAGTKATEDYNGAGNTDSGRKTVELVSGWPTPQETWGAAGSTSLVGDRIDEPLIGGLVRGLTPSSSTAETGKPAAYRLNAIFSLWLMGFNPAAWASCGARAMQSCRRSRLSSSKRT